MNNRQRLLSTNIYDVLMQMNDNLNPFSGNPCVLECLCGDNVDVPALCINYRQCEECIQNWLNEEEK